MPRRKNTFYPLLRKKDAIALITLILTLTAALYCLKACHSLISNTFQQTKQSKTRYQLLFYHNSKQHHGTTRASAAVTVASPLSTSHYPKGGTAIATLVTKKNQRKTTDIDDLISVVKGLALLRGDDDPEYPSPILIFHEGDLTEHQKRTLVESTNRPVAFPIVDFDSFPPGFNPDDETPNVPVKDFSNWDYHHHQTIRFWLNTIWKHPAIAPFGTVMRIDPDSCFLEPNDYLPNLQNDYSVYHSQYVGFVPPNQRDSIRGLYDFTDEWRIRLGRMPDNPMMWQFVQMTWERDWTLPVFRTSFEVFRTSWWTKKGDVRRYVEALTEREPFGVLRRGWNYSAIRFLMAAMFATNEMILTSRPIGFAPKELCDPEAYRERFQPNYKQK